MSGPEPTDVGADAVAFSLDRGEKVPERVVSGTMEMARHARTNLASTTAASTAIGA